MYKYIHCDNTENKATLTILQPYITHISALLSNKQILLWQLISLNILLYYPASKFSYGS